MIYSIRTFARWFSLMIFIWTTFAEAVTLSEDDLIVLDLKTHTMPAGAIVQTDGKFILAGATMQDEVIQVVLARYYPSGELDTSFGKSGYTFTRIPDWHAHANAVELDADGNILIGGTARDGNRKPPQYFLIRYLNSGKLDLDFNGSGIRLNALEERDYSYSFTLQNDGKIIQIGNSLPSFFSRFKLLDFIAPGYHFSLVRMHPDGKLDSNFGSSGSVLTRVGDASEDHANAVALQPNGNILVTGYSHTRYAGDFTVLRYNNNGRLDKSFASTGILVNRLMNSYGSMGTSLAVQRDGHILVGGSLARGKHSGNNELIVVRLTPSGDFDYSFGDQGLVRLFSGKWGSKGSSIAVQGDGKILVSGRNRGQGSFILSRLLSNGVPDISFANKGYVQFDFSEGDIYPKNIKLLKNEEILVSGLITYRACLTKKLLGALFLLRLTADGKLFYLSNG